MTAVEIGTDSRGFTLVELLTALTLLSLVLLPTLGRINHLLRQGERRSIEMQEAQLLLRAELELHSTGFENRTIDTVMVDGSRFQLINRLIAINSDTTRNIVVMTMRGTKWDTLLAVSKAHDYRIEVLSH